MKNTWLLFGLAGLTTTLLSFTFIQKNDQVQEPKKPRHIKMTRIENGKKMELDTVVYGNDVFVWRGDTIRGTQMGKHASHSGPDQMQQIFVTGDPEDGNEDIMIIRHGDAKPGEPRIRNMDTGDDMEIVTEDIDSLGKRIVIRKRMRDGNENKMIYFNDGDRSHLPPMPPPPPPHLKMQHGGQIINLNDPNIISFRKKDLKGDREKIEIIRKKSEGPENMSFDFNFDDELMPPPPPDAPEIIRGFNNDGSEMKIIRKEKKTDGKNGKEIEVQVETKEKK